MRRLVAGGKTIMLVVYSATDTVYSAAVHSKIDEYRRADGRILYDESTSRVYDTLSQALADFAKEILYSHNLHQVDFIGEYVVLKDE